MGKRAKVKHMTDLTVRLGIEAIEPGGAKKKNAVQNDSLGKYSEV